jgi:aminoglycoside phosphotransferase family enzyme/predicted kinase
MQRDVVAFLSTPAAYGLTSGPIERIDTHISTVWLAGDRAYKLKRAVRFDYVDFSTAELRHAACDAEIRLNRRTAPMLYIAVRAVTRQHDGSLALDGSGEPIDWVIEMKRFDQETLFDRLAERGRLDIATMSPLAAAIAHLHAGARIRTDHGGRAGMAWVADGNAREFLEHGAGVLAPALCARLAGETRTELCRHAARLDARCRAGLVRECHGDLHLRNICLVDGAPIIFDGIEFNDDISCIDVLYDVAFVLMDLWRRGLEAHANALFNEYIGATGDVDALCLLPLFLSCRAAVRAKTSLTAAAQSQDVNRRRELERAAVQYLELSGTFLRPSTARLIAIGGFSGSGKSTLARALAPGVGAAPGALVVRSDLLRKSMMGVPALNPLDDSGYTPVVTRRVYRELTVRALAALKAGHTVIADAVFARPDDRTAIAEAAHAAGVPFLGLWLEAPPAILAQRVADRPLDASDATVAVLDDQVRAGPGAIEWERLDGAMDITTVLRHARALLESTGHAFGRR